MKISTEDAFVTAFVSKAHAVKMPQSKMAEVLSDLGYTSKDGRQLSASHISNFEKDDLGLTRVKKYVKINYPMNHVTATKIQDAGLWPLKVKIENGDGLTKEELTAIEGAGLASEFLKISEHYRIEA